MRFLIRRCLLSAPFKDLRSFSSSTASEDIFEGIKSKVEKKSGYRDWLKEIKAKLEAHPIGPYYLGGETLFPFNPSFKPVAPITDALRNRIFQLHLSDPEGWTPRKLSTQFKVSIPRVKAIIKVKRLEAEQIAEGKLKPNPEYVQKMEEMLGAKVPVHVETMPVRDNSISNFVRPTFVAIPESSPMLTPQVTHRTINFI